MLESLTKFYPNIARILPEFALYIFARISLKLDTLAIFFCFFWGGGTVTPCPHISYAYTGRYNYV